MRITDIINKKKEDKKNLKVDNVIAQDLNRPLILALFGIDVYGKEATDDSILELIIGKPELSPAKQKLLTALEDFWDSANLKGEITEKNGRYYHQGNIVLKPITR